MNRRLFLKGLGGIAIGLPFLESLAFASGTPAAPKRLCIFFQCNGVNMSKFFPATPYGPLTAASFTGTSLQPLASYAGKLLIPRGIHKVPKGYNLDGQTPLGCDHQNGMGGKLTAQALTGADHYANGISVDQAAARSINPPGRAPLTLKVGPRGSGVLSVISYNGPNQPVQGENNPWFAFRDFMGFGTPPPSAPAATDAGTPAMPPAPPVTNPVEQRMSERRMSVLDFVKGDMDALKARGLSRADRDKLDLHFTSIRDIEVRLMDAGLPQMQLPMPAQDAGQSAPLFYPPQCNLPAARVTELQGLDPNTVGTDAEYRRMGQLQMDVMALALACDRTRVTSLQWGNGSQGPIFNWDGMTNQYNHHKLSHGNTRDDNSGTGITDYLDRLHAIDTWHAQQLAYLLGKLSAYTELDGTLLDNTVVAWVNELSDGKAHDFRDMPIVLAGGAGYFRTGEYVKVTAQASTSNSIDAPHSKLLTMMLNAVGAKQADGSAYTTFGSFGAPGELQSLKR